MHATKFITSYYVISILYVGLALMSCSQAEGDSNSLASNEESIAGHYYGTAIIEEQFIRDGVTLFDTSYITSDELIVTELNVEEKEYHFELRSEFKTYFNQSPLQPTPYFLDDRNTVWVGFDEFGYTYDNKKHWKFDPKQDTVYFRLARFPYGPTLVDDPDSIGHYHEEIHRWDYVLKAEK